MAALVSGPLPAAAAAAASACITLTNIRAPMTTTFSMMVEKSRTINLFN
jgi:hypothetical protein